MLKKPKIVCTIGPASVETETLKGMLQAGMNCVRINTAYGDLESYKQSVDNIRKLSDLPIMIDLKGPEIRLRTEDQQIVNIGDKLYVGFSGESISFNHNIIAEMNIGDLVYIDNGKIKTAVIEKDNKSLVLLVERGGIISNGKGVNVPNKILGVPTLSQRDKKIIDFAKKYHAEFLALSFTRNAKDITKLRSAAKGFEGAVLSKIENFEGITNFKEILEASDAIMIARGDLGVEIDSEKVPLVQKSLIRMCNQEGKPVVTATEMLESMMHNPNPTRAEVSDVANAILDGTDATMLSGETAVGKYPVDAVEMMARIAVEAQKATRNSVRKLGFVNISDTVSWSIHKICTSMPITKIVTLTRSGYTAKMISRFKIESPIIAVTPNLQIKKQLELVYGVVPVHYDYTKKDDRLMSVAIKLHEMELLHIEDLVLFTAAFRTKMPHSSNLIEIHTLKELLEFKKTVN
ncbi:MAG: pyruvate kinase [Candidatus Bathyarchaeota archaeon]|nr:pyruvate kinase [Candidatus Bathyarchaeum tardum]